MATRNQRLWETDMDNPEKQRQSKVPQKQVSQSLGTFARTFLGIILSGILR